MTDDVQEFAGALILVIDDEDTQRLLTRDCLEQEGYRVEEASNGEDGLNKTRDIQPDLVLLDVMMPGIDGFEVCRQLRADPVIRHTPVIIITGRENTEDVKKGFAVGATDFLAKPVRWNLIPNRVSYVLRTSRLEQELRVAKEAAEKASDAKSALMSTLGHELRTPLNAIIGFSEMMKQAVYGPLGSPKYDDFITDIHASGAQLLLGINAMLEIVSCGSENLVLDEEEIGVCDLVNAIVKEISPEAEACGVELKTDVPDDHVYISGDAARLREALFHLASNAVKFTGIGGLVAINTALMDDNRLVLTIADNGIGISAKDLPRIMEPFEQADKSLSRGFEGLGLGIPLALAMIRLHGGDIEYESELGHGTTVRAWIPAARITSMRDRNPAPLAANDAG